MAKKQIILLNFGGPTKASEVYPFLRNLFEDPLIVRAPLLFRKWLARRIAQKRMANTTSEYESIGFSPICRITESLAKQLGELSGAAVHVINRYTQPRAWDVLKGIEADAPTWVLPLYPHFCHSTTASSIKDFDDANKKPAGPGIVATKIFSWWMHPAYDELCVKYVQNALSEMDADGMPKPWVVLVSAHGIPQKYADKGDPYPHEIRSHFEALKRRFETKDCKFELSFQSRVGPVQWLKPYTDDAIRGLSHGSVLMMPISFVSDHIETLYEMDVTYRDLAQKKGLGFKRVNVPNDSPEFASVLLDILKSHGFR